MKNIKHVVRRPRRPGEYITPCRKAIRSFCIECMGNQPHEIKDCTSRQCHLWPFRDPSVSPQRQVADEKGISSFDEL